MNFTHLHVHSEYSLLDGLSSIPKLVARAQALGFDSLALTDHGSLYGIIEFYEECQRAGIKPIIGAELYVAQRRLTDKQNRLDDRPYHLVVLAENIEGYNNLLKLVSTAHLEGYYYKPRVDFELLEQHHQGLIALSACLNGQVARTVLEGELGAALTIVRRYQQIFGKDNFFLELQHHPTLPQQARLNEALQTLAQQSGAPLVATADSHYLEPTDADAQDVLVCIQTKKLLSDTQRMSMRSEDYSLASAVEMAERFKAWPEALERTQQIAARCQVTLPLGTIHIPYYGLPEGVTADQQLRQLCEVNMPKQYLTEAEQSDARRRLDYELEVIAKTGFASYFLIVQDFVNWAKSQHIVVGPGRGSAAGSIVAYLTRITNIDPLRYDLLFERFLNPDRISMPDIDLDFADSRRDEVIRYVESKYGKDHVAQIITFGTMAARAAVRDVGRVLGVSYGFCDMVAKLIPATASLAEALEQIPELQQLYQSDADATRLLDMAKKLEGVVRHTSTHACGVVITPRALNYYTPVQYASSSDRDIVTQYSLHPIERLGLLKMDFLGLKNLTIIEQTIERIEKTTEQPFDIETIPFDDKRTYRLLQAAQTTGIFQLESAGMKRYLRELKPTDFDDIIAMVALYRPGPMERIPDYITGKHGKRTVTYLLPELKPILEKTHGILVYQEQVMALARDIAGFTAGEGYLLIKAVAKKIPQLLNEQKQKFIEGCVRKGVARHIAEQLWEFIEPFAHYGFNKSHSTGYALIAYQTAYLKANYPAQFMASLLTSDANDTERIAIEVQEARDMGIEVLPPDVNESYSTFTVVKESLTVNHPRIRFGLAAIKNVGQNLVSAIIAERKANGPFVSLEDFLQRLHHKDLNKKSLESLIKCGACVALGEMSTLLNNIDTLLQYNKQAQQEKISGQGNLFASLGVAEAPRLFLTTAPLLNQRQVLQWEKDLLGLYVSAHPLQKMYQTLTAHFMELKLLKDQRQHSLIDTVVLIQVQKRILTKKNESMLFLTASDPSDEIEVVVFPSVMKDMKTVINEGDCVRIKGKLQKRNGEIKIIAEEVLPWSDQCVIVELPDQSTVLPQIKQILGQSTGEFPVYFRQQDKTMFTTHRLNTAGVDSLRQLIGEHQVILL